MIWGNLYLCCQASQPDITIIKITATATITPVNTIIMILKMQISTTNNHSTKLRTNLIYQWVTCCSGKIILRANLMTLNRPILLTLPTSLPTNQCKPQTNFWFKVRKCLGQQLCGIKLNPVVWMAKLRKITTTILALLPVHPLTK